jgi:hypothetical protein
MPLYLPYSGDPQVVDIAGLTPTDNAVIIGNGTNFVVESGSTLKTSLSLGTLVESTVLVGSAVSLTTATETNITSISLPAGKWWVWGLLSYLPNAATTYSGLTGWIHTTSATFPTVPNGGAYVSQVGGMTTGNAQHIPAGGRHYEFGSTTTVYLTTYAGFGVNTLAAYGYLGAIQL